MTTEYALVTGASTDIGYASAAGFAEKGYHVFAEVRNERDAERIRVEHGGKLEPIRIDVTNAWQRCLACRA